MDKCAKIFIAGHRGMAGSAILRCLIREGYTKTITRTRQEVDLMDAKAVAAFFEAERPEIVVDAAARVGGIAANWEKPVEFLLENMTIQNNLIKASADSGVRKLLFLGSSCIYPKLAPQPIPESSLLTGSLEPTNEAYAIAKISGIRLCQAYARQYGKNFISAMPTNLYGPNDNYDLQTSHVVPAMIRKIHQARASEVPEVVIWGTGTPRREFLHVDDLAGACHFLLQSYDSPEVINVGFGDDVSIRELAETICDVLDYRGNLVFDASKPDGTPRKLLDCGKLSALGWKPSIDLRSGIRNAYDWFVSSRWASAAGSCGAV